MGPLVEAGFGCFLMWGIVRLPLYALIGLACLGWWIVEGAVGGFDSIQTPWWSAASAAVTFTANYWAMRAVKVFQQQTAFWILMIATEVLLWSAVAHFGFQRGFALFFVAASLGLVLFPLVLFVERGKREFGGLNDDEVGMYGTSRAIVIGLGAGVGAMFLGGNA